MDGPVHVAGRLQVHRSPDIHYYKSSCALICRAAKELVDGPCHEAWAQAASGLLPAGAAPLGWQTGEEWQAAIR